MQMALAVFSVMPEAEQHRVKGRLLALQALNRTGAKEALAWLDYETSNCERKQLIDEQGAELFREAF